MKEGTRIASHANTCFEPTPTMLNMGAAAASLPFCATTSAWTCDQPPRVCIAKGIASRRPDIVTASSNILTKAEDISQPAVQYTIDNVPTMTQPSHLGMPATVLRIHEIAMICAARIARAPHQKRIEIRAFTALP